VTVCGTSLCQGSQPWDLYGGAVFNGLDDPNTTVQGAVAARLNTVRVVNFLYEFDPVAQAAYRERDWSRLDRFIATARDAGLKVVLDLSTYRNLLRFNGIQPYTYDWGPFLVFAANRTNTVTGVRYRDDPTIALISLAGEPEPITGNSDPLKAASSQQLTDFYRRSYSQLRAADPNHIISSGGLLQYGWNSGIDWRSIFAVVDLCALHGYSESDLAAVPTIAATCAGMGKPWITEEFGYQQSLGDAARASAYQSIYDLQRTNRSAGVSFWSLGPEIKMDSHDVNSATPLVWAVIQENAP
jgi:endo-1,4-beta-mannosidase